eukprot:scaffold26_cov117-Cylindrotheca_fusiformis.AAC.10
MVRDNLLAKSNIGEADLVLGQEYFGSIVTKVQVQVDDSEKRYKIKRFVNLKNGMILVEDYWRDKSLGFMESTEYSLPPGYFGDESPKDDSALREKARALLAKRRSSAAADKEKKKQKRKSKNKEKRRSEKSSSMEPPESRPETAPQPATKPEVVPMTSESESPEREEPSETQTIDERPGSPFSLEGSSEVQDASERAGSPFIQEPSETQELSERGESPVMDKPSEAQETSETPSIMAGDWKTLNATVVPISNLPEEAANYEGDSPQLGVWKHNDPKDDKDWDPLDVVISKTEPSDLAYDEPHGIVAVEEDTKSNSVGKLPAEKLLFFSPGDKPDLAISRPVGIWRPAKSSSQFPPTNGDKTHPRSPSESESPSIMHGDWKTLNATVVPISNLPKEAANYEGDSPQLGVWKHKDDKDWDPLDVVISKTEPSDLAYDEPHGIVAVEEDAKPNSVGKLPAEKLLFFLPGDKPDVSISRPVGIWRPATSSSQFPPINGNKPHLRTLSKLENEKKEDEDRQLNLGKLPLWRQRDDFAPVKAIVFPQQKAPKENNQDEDAKGVWKSKKAVPDDTAPQEVTLYPKNAALDESKPNGLWGIHSSSIPDAFGQVKPENVLFYPQGETPDDDDGCSLHGKWTSASKEPKKVGKLRSIWKEHIPKKATVYPRRNAPEFQENTENAIGVWKFPSAGTTDPSENWIPADVEIFEVDKKPQDWLDDSTNGVWGLDGPVDSNKGKEAPDLVFYPPNEKTEEGFEPLGVWRLPQKQTWPPRRVAKLVSPDMAWGGSPQPKKRSVGKLTVPDIFGEVSPSPGSRRKLPSPAGSRPSIPSTSSNSTTPGDKLSDDTQFPPTNLKVAHPRSNGNPTDKPISEASPMAPESRKSVDPDESSSRKVGKLPKWQREDDWISDKAMVYPPGKAPRDIMLDHLSRGTWRSSDQLPDDWVPLEVTIVPEHSDVLDEENPNGIWGINSLSETDESGRWRPEDVLFYPPGEVPGEDCSRRGRWSVGGGKWPPKGLDLPVKPNRTDSSSDLDENSNSRRNVGKLPKLQQEDGIPVKPHRADSSSGIDESNSSGRNVGKLPKWQREDGWISDKAMVYPPGKAPRDIMLDHLSRGTWRSSDQLPDDWVPLEVTIFPEHSDALDEENPNGIWGINSLSETDESGRWRPEDVLFYPPGEVPGEDCSRRGRWSVGGGKWPPRGLDLPVKPSRFESSSVSEFDEEPANDSSPSGRRVGKLPNWQSGDDWVPERAMVSLRRNAPEENTLGDVPRGVWKSKNALPDDWVPQELVMHPRQADVETETPNGLWGTNAASEVDENGLWRPEDILFYPPNESPEDDCEVRGRWTLGEKAKWPPITGAMPRASNERKVGKLPKWQSDKDWVSDKAIVFSSKNAPSDSTDDVPRGIWKSKNPLPDNMEAQEVIVYPNNSTLDESKPNGIWGTSSVSPPDRNGRWAPKDVMFYPPNETPKKDECTPRGRWSVGESAVLPFALDLPNPPAREVSPEPRPAEFRESIASPTRTPRQVGKLKVPGVFEKSPGASPRVSARRTPTSASRKRLLLRNSIAAEKRPVLPSILEEDWETLPATVVSDSTGSLADTIEGAEMENASDPPVGVWKHSEKMDDSTWGAVDVTVHRTKPNDLKAGEPYGTVAVIPDAKANSVGKIQPRQLQFFAPGADTDPPSLRKVGVWRFSEPGGGWPPNGSNRNVGRLSQIASNFDSPRKSNKVGKLPKWQTTDGDWKSSRGIVFPRKHAPRGNIDDVSRGVWKSKNPIDDNWEAQDVVLHPENTPAIDDGTPNGIWGTLSSSEPDEKGQWKPHDVLFYPPGEAPGEECKRRGKWSLSLGPKAKWPPAVTSFVSPSRVSKLSGLPSPVSSPSPRTRSVGKLKLPDLFSGK